MPVMLDPARAIIKRRLPQTAPLRPLATPGAMGPSYAAPMGTVETAEDDTTMYIVAGVGVLALAGLGWWGYKKGWFGKKGRRRRRG